jgi:hypothetical protein
VEYGEGGRKAAFDFWMDLRSATGTPDGVDSYQGIAFGDAAPALP